MNRFTLLAAAAGATAAFAAATPAAAQYNYGYQQPYYGQPYQQPVYGQQYGYGYNNGQNVVGQIINSVIGYGRYPYGNYGYGQSTYMSQQTALQQCAAAAEARLNNYALNNQYNRWNPYNNPYSNWAVRGQGRVLGIEKVRVKALGRIKVSGVATSGQQYNTPWGYGGYGYNSQYGVPDLKFSCDADSSGRVYDVDFKRYRYGR